MNNLPGDEEIEEKLAGRTPKTYSPRRNMVLGGVIAAAVLTVGGLLAHLHSDYSTKLERLEDTCKVELVDLNDTYWKTIPVPGSNAQEASGNNAGLVVKGGWFAKIEQGGLDLYVSFTRQPLPDGVYTLDKFVNIYFPDASPKLIDATARINGLQDRNLSGLSSLLVPVHAGSLGVRTAYCDVYVKNQQ